MNSSLKPQLFIFAILLALSTTVEARPTFRSGRLADIFEDSRIVPGAATATKIQPFATDFCSHFPEGSNEDKWAWAHCCVRHDQAYWQGGTQDERLLADQELRVCVRESGHAKVARLMYVGVRAGGAPFRPTSFRWGYGWPYGVGYRVLSGEQKASATQEWEKFCTQPPSEGEPYSGFWALVCGR